MNVIWVVFVLAILRLTFSSELLPYSLENRNFLHNLCLGIVKTKELSSIYRGLICGSTDIGATEKTLLQNLGLYHLIVVSGSHLVFIEQIFNFFSKKHYKLKTAGLLFFAIVCQLNPPIVRAFVSYLLRGLSSHFKLFFSEDQIVLIAGLLTIVLFPHWWMSLSLILSWLTSLSLNHSGSLLKKQLMVALYLLPFYGGVDASVVFNNLLVHHAFGFVLFPLSALTFALPYGAWLGNPLWNFTLRSLNHLPEAQFNFSITPQHVLFYWALICGLHIIHHLKRYWR